MPLNRLPRKPTRLPKGTCRADYTDEALAAFDANSNRIRVEKHRKRLKHRGIKEVSFNAGQETRDKLERMKQMTGLSKTKLLNHLIEKAYEYQTATEPHHHELHQPAQAAQPGSATQEQDD